MIDQLAKQFFTDIKDTLDKHAPNSDVPASQLNAILESGLKKLNLVTREEFDAQQAVLLRTRTKLEALEQKIDDLEKMIPKD